RFDPQAGRWMWDMAAVRAVSAGDNVLDFMIGGLRRLPADTQRTLELAACIGNTFDLHTLSVIAEKAESAVARALNAALTHHIVVPMSDSYKFASLGANDAADDTDDDRAAPPVYRFQHDRVQQAAYALI